MSRDAHLVDKCLKKIEYTFKWCGMNVDSIRRSYAENVRYKIVYLINFLWVNTDLVGGYCWFIQGVKQGKSLTTLTYNSPCITFTSLINCKSISIYVYENEINELITSLRELERKENDRPRFAKKEEIIKSEIKFLLMILKIYNFFNWSVIVLFNLMPITMTAIKYFNDNEIELLLPLLIAYPFDASDIRFWPIAYIHQIWSVVIVILECGGTDSLFYICSTHIRIQFRLLRHDIEKIFETSAPSEIFCESEEFNAKLAELITRHQNVLRLAELLETIYSKSTLFNFVSSSMLICLTGFNVMKLDDKAFVMAFLSFLLIILLQIFFLCFFGDLLMRSSIEVNDGVYNCKWYLSKASTRKKLNVIQTRAQKPSKVTAFGFADVNLRAFTKILSTAWSYFALLNTVYSTPHQ